MCFARSIKERLNSSPRNVLGLKIVGVLAAAQGLALLGSQLGPAAQLFLGESFSFFEALMRAAGILGTWMAQDYLVLLWAVATLSFVHAIIRLNKQADKLNGWQAEYSGSWLDFITLPASAALLIVFYGYFELLFPSDASLAYRVSLFSAIALLVCSLTPWLFVSSKLDSLLVLILFALFFMCLATGRIAWLELGEYDEFFLFSLVVFHFVASIGGLVAGGLLCKVKAVDVLLRQKPDACQRGKLPQRGVL